MNTAAHIIKLVFAWGMFVGGVVCFVVAPQFTVPMFAGSIAASLLPE